MRLIFLLLILLGLVFTSLVTQYADVRLDLSDNQSILLAFMCCIIGSIPAWVCIVTAGRKPIKYEYVQYDIPITIPLGRQTCCEARLYYSITGQKSAVFKFCEQCHNRIEGRK